LYLNKYKIYALIVSFLALLLVTACAELDSHSSISRFLKSENVLRASMRWGEWVNAFALLKSNPDNPSSKIESPSEEYLAYLSTLKIAHVKVLTSGITEEDKAGESLFLIEYRFDNSAKIHKIRHKVDWWYHKESNTWFTDTPLPKEFDIPEPRSRTIKLSPKAH